MVAIFTSLVLAIWLVVGLRTGIWTVGFLASVLVLTFFFVVLYTVSALVGMGTRSPIVAIVVTCLVWFMLWLVATLYVQIDSSRKTRDWPEWAYPTIDALHYTLPRTKDLDLLMTEVLSRELLPTDEAKREMGATKLPKITWAESLTISGVFVTALLSLASWRFYRRDY